MREGAARAAALDHLYQGQSNDCYWHGVFGGIYLPHMRLATFAHLIAADDTAEMAAQDADAAWPRAQLVDIDLDGRDEALMTEPGQVVGVKLDEGAGIGRWDILAVRHALTAVMRRRPEAYHWKLLDKAGTPDEAGEADESGGAATSGEAARAEAAEAAKADAPAGASAPVSIHELVASKETGLSRYLRYDAYERRSGLVHLLAQDVRPEAFREGQFDELGDFIDRPFEVVELAPGRLVVAREGSVGRGSGEAAQAVQVEKRLSLAGGRRDPVLGHEVIVRNRSAEPLSLRVGVEWSLMLLGGGGNPAAFHEVVGKRTSHDSSGKATAVEDFSAGNSDVGITVSTTLSPPGDVWWSPIETVSNSEAGFERIYQGSCVLVNWPVEVAPGGSFSVSIENRVSTDRDVALDDPVGAMPAARR
jgi:alpha-amylase